MRNTILAMLIAPCALWACGQAANSLDRGHQVSDIGKCYDDCTKCKESKQQQSERSKVVKAEEPFQMDVRGHRYNAFAAADAPFLLEYDGHLWVAVMLQHSDLCGCKEDLEHVWHEPTNNGYELGN